MNLSLEALARRREALVQRSGAQRAAIASAIERARNASTAPLLLGAGGLVALISTSPKLRSWLVRAWAFYSLVRRFR
ncbi:MAG TPA: hypothetical protein VFU24_09575 [Burkholderiales bacterium]|nr:hypothetical protein [Burkholderiales bacterium]